MHTTHHSVPKTESRTNDASIVVVKAFSSLVRRRGGIKVSGQTSVAADGTIGGHRPSESPPLDSAESDKSKRQHLDEKARAYAKFCRSRC